MEDSFESIQIPDDELTSLIKTSGNIIKFASISNLKKKEDGDMLAMLIENLYITKNFDDIYKLLSPYLKNENEDELKPEEKPKYNEKSIRLKKYKSVSRVKYILDKMNTDLIAIKQYVIEHKNVEFTEEIVTMCNYIISLMDFVYKNKEKEEDELKKILKF